MFALALVDLFLVDVPLLSGDLNSIPLDLTIFIRMLNLTSSRFFSDGITYVGTIFGRTQRFGDVFSCLRLILDQYAAKFNFAPSRD